MVILMGVYGHSALSIFIYAALSVLFMAVYVMAMNKFNKDFSLAHLFGFLSWVASMVSYSFMYWPHDWTSVAGTLTIAFFATFEVMFLVPLIVWSVSEIPSIIKESKSNKASKKLDKEKAKKAAMNAASLEKLKNLIDL